jgi:DNA-binding NarL/FixJ family response regulator
MHTHSSAQTEDLTERFSTVSRSAGPLLERSSEVRRLAALREAAARGHGGAAMLDGPAGIGKSRLLASACADAARGGFRVLRATGSELERDYGFGIAQQLLAPILAQQAQPDAQRLLDGAAGLAAGVLRAGDAPPLSNEHSALHGLYWLTANLCDVSPLLIAVDDLQWADAPSLRFLLHLCSRVGELPALVLLSLRSGETATAPGLLDALTLAVQGPVLRPRALSPRAVAELASATLARDLDPDVTAACAEVTGGNPFLLVELLYALADGELTADAVRALTPQRVLASVMLRLRARGAQAVGVARAVAVLGHGATVAQVAELAQLDHHVAGDLLDVLVRADILIEDGQFAFRHPLLREAVYGDLPSGERAAAHRRAATLLRAAARPDAEAIGLHLMHVEPGEDARAVETLRAAGQAALARGAAETAYEYLLRATREPVGDALKIEVLAGLALAAGRAGRADAAAPLEQAFALTRSQPERASVGLRLIGARAASTADPVHTDKLLGEALSGVEDTELPAGLEAGALLYIGGLPRLHARFGARLDRARARAATLPPALLSPVAAFALSRGATAAEAASMSERALLGGEVIREDLRSEIPLAMPAIMTLAWCGRLLAAARAVQVAVDLARAGGSLFALARFLPLRALVALRCGDLLAAEADAGECLELAGEPGWELASAMAAAVLAAVCLERGEVDRARELIAPLDRVPAAAESVALQILSEVRIRLLIAGAEPEAALINLEHYVDWMRGCGIEARVGLIPWRSLSALAHHDAGEVEPARRLAEEALDAARGFGADTEVGGALIAAGLVGEGSDRLRRLREAVAVLASTDARLEHARALVELGCALADGGDLAAARQALAEGMDRADRCAATALVQRARSALLKTGARPRRTATTGVQALTPSQLRVARLAASGMTNREIAQALFLTVRSVELHLSNAYRTLGIGSRAQLRALVEPPT